MASTLGAVCAIAALCVVGALLVWIKRSRRAVATQATNDVTIQNTQAQQGAETDASKTMATIADDPAARDTVRTYFETHAGDTPSEPDTTSSGPDNGKST